MDNFEFANRIVELRKQKGLSQKELGDMLGVSNKAVSKWENGESMPKLSTMLKLAEIMGIDGNELIGLQPGQNESPAVDKSELDRLKSENASLSSQLGKMNKKRKRFFIVSLLLCAVGIVVCSIVAFGFNANEKINNKVTDAGCEGTKIEFADLTFVVPDEYQRYSLLSGKDADCYPDTKYADYYDKNGKKEKVVIKCNEFSDSVLLEVRRQKYFYVNTAVNKDNIKYDNIESISLENRTIAYSDYISNSEFSDKEFNKQNGSGFIKEFCLFYQNKGYPVDKKQTSAFLGHNPYVVTVNFEYDGSKQYQELLFIELGEFFTDNEDNLYFYDYVTAESYSVGKELKQYVIED